MNRRRPVDSLLPAHQNHQSQSGFYADAKLVRHDVAAICRMAASRNCPGSVGALRGRHRKVQFRCEAQVTCARAVRTPRRCPHQKGTP